jgi:hypothetical protein
VARELLARMGEGAGPALADAVDAIGEASDWLLERLATSADSRSGGRSGLDDALAGSVPYLRMWGIALGGWLLERSATAAAEKPAGFDSTFLDGKPVVSRFYAAHLLPQVRGLLPAVTAGSEVLFAVTNP